MNQIVFPNSVQYTVIPERTVAAVVRTMTGITINQMVDNPNSKIVAVFTKELGRIELWKGEEYDAIGQWTDNDVVDKIKSIFNVE